MDSRPRIGGELLQPEGDLLLVVVDAQNLDGDLVAGLDDLRRVRHAGPPHLGHVQQALHAATQVDERAELAHGGDAPGHHRAGDDRSPDLGGARPLLLLEKRTPRDDEVPAAFLVLDDPEFVDAPFVRRRVRSGGCRSERSGRRRAGGRCAPRSRPSPPVRPFLPPEDRCGTRLRAAAAVAAPRASFRESVSPPTVDTTIGLNAVADGDLEIAVGVLQFVDVDRGFALAADVDERHLRADRDDRALDGLALLEALRFERSLEHRGEIFVGLAHGAGGIIRPFSARGPLDVEGQNSLH